MVRVPEVAEAVAPPTAQRRSRVVPEVTEAFNLLVEGQGAVVGSWQVVALESTKSLATVRTVVTRLRKEGKYPNALRQRGRLRVYKGTDGTIYMASRI
jgi:hypothetical protein